MSQETITHWVEALELLPHPEGGFYKETYRSTESHAQGHLPDRFSGDRSYGTGIYFLLTAGNFSAFHRIQSDELWHFYAGDPLSIHVIHPTGEYVHLKLGQQPDLGMPFQQMVPARSWFASEVMEGGAYSLVGCTVAPGFDFADFELAEADKLSKAFTAHEALIRRLTRQ
ncbi:MAG: cupin domain-containing protein [Bacteroidota bacterium]